MFYKRPKISILIPVYNVSDYIARCISSICEQTFTDFEIILIDDCSPDNSISIAKAVVKKYPNVEKKFRIISHEYNKGLAVARNSGIANAIADYVLHVDSDDFIEPNTLDILYNKAIEGDADIVICNYCLDWGNLNKKVIVKKRDSKELTIQAMLEGKGSVSIWNKLIKRSLYLDNNISNVEGINFGEDLLITPQLFYYAKKIEYVDEVLYHYVQLNQSSYTKKLSRKSIDNIVFVMCFLRGFFGQAIRIHPNYDNAILRGMVRKKISLLLECDSKDRREVLKTFPESNQLKEFNFLSLKERVFWRIVNTNNYYLLDFYIKIYKKSIYTVQILKGRTEFTNC